MVHLLMAGWWLAWVLVVVPAHTRGAISLGGECAACGEGKVSYCFGTVKGCCAGKHEKEPGEKRSSGDCAICQIVGTTSNAAPALPVLTYLEMAGVLRPVAPSGAVHYAVLGLPMGTGPPVG